MDEVLLRMFQPLAFWPKRVGIRRRYRGTAGSIPFRDLASLFHRFFFLTEEPVEEILPGIASVPSIMPEVGENTETHLRMTEPLQFVQGGIKN